MIHCVKAAALTTKQPNWISKAIPDAMLLYLFQYVNLPMLCGGSTFICVYSILLLFVHQTLLQAHNKCYFIFKSIMVVDLF